MPDVASVMPGVASVTPDDAADADAVARIEQELARMTHRARTRWREAAADVHPGLQPTGYRMLLTLMHLGGAKSSALAEALEVDRSVVSRQVHQLHEWGLIRTRTDEADRRCILLEATPSAVARVEQVRAKRREHLQSFLRGQSPESLDAMADLLRLLDSF